MALQKQCPEAGYLLGIWRLEAEGVSFCLNLSGASQPSTSLPSEKYDQAGLTILQEKSFNLKLSCDEVYCTNTFLLLVKIMLLSKLITR